MRLMFLGDIVGKSGRDAVMENLPKLKTSLNPDFIVVNGENAAGGFGINEEIADNLFAAGVDVITTGNHVWDQRDVLDYLDREYRILRPVNYPQDTPGNGAGLFQTKDGRRVLVINVMLRLFMDPLDDPFRSIETKIEDNPLAGSADFILIDMHGEATSEKMALGHNFDGRVTAILGTHTHVPTADQMILAAGTAYQTDVGMCGDYDSVIGMKKDAPIRRFVSKLPGSRLEPADGEATICGTIVTSDDRTGLATNIQPIRLGGVLSQSLPD